MMRPILLVTVFLLISLHGANALKLPRWTTVQKNVAKGLSTFIIATQVIAHPATASAAVSTFQEQLKVIQALQVEQQMINVKKAMSNGGASNGGKEDSASSWLSSSLYSTTAFKMA